MINVLNFYKDKNIEIKIFFCVSYIVNIEFNFSYIFFSCFKLYIQKRRLLFSCLLFLNNYETKTEISVSYFV